MVSLLSRYPRPHLLKCRWQPIASSQLHRNGPRASEHRLKAEGEGERQSRPRAARRHAAGVHRASAVLQGAAAPERYRPLPNRIAVIEHVQVVAALRIVERAVLAVTPIELYRRRPDIGV